MPCKDPMKKTWFVLPEKLRDVFSPYGKPEEILKYFNDTYNCWNGGNQWSSWAGYMSFFKHVAQIEELQATWDAFEVCAKHSGPRIMHEHFVVVSDRPTQMHVDEQFRSHCETGPFCAWADGFGFYAWHGNYIPAWILEDHESITVNDIKSMQNAETRRIMREVYGESKYILNCNPTVIDADTEGAKQGAAPRILLKDEDGRYWLVGTDGSTTRVYYMEVPAGTKTCKEAHEILCGFDESRIVAKS